MSGLREELEQLAARWARAQINRAHEPGTVIRLYGEGVEHGYECAADDLRDLLARHPVVEPVQT